MTHERTPAEPYFPCPVCGEPDFDKLGITLHLRRGCDEAERLIDEYNAELHKRHAERLGRKS